jgi:hypothetical protein
MGIRIARTGSLLGHRAIRCAGRHRAERDVDPAPE